MSVKEDALLNDMVIIYHKYQFRIRIAAVPLLDCMPGQWHHLPAKSPRTKNTVKSHSHLVTRGLVNAETIVVLSEPYIVLRDTVYTCINMAI